MTICVHEGHSVRFETTTLAGILDAEGQAANPLCNHRIRNLTHRPTQTLLTPDRVADVSSRFGLSLFRVYARNACLGELRATPYAARPLENGVEYAWQPFVGHAVALTCRITIQSPNAIDLDLTLKSYAAYTGYEILLSSYWAPGFEPGGYVRSGNAPRQIRPHSNEVYAGQYLFFPQDTQAAGLLTDGRGARGRWCWEQCVGRRYALPMGFFSNGQVDALLMGRPADVSAVGMSYAGDEQTDPVAGHRGLYLSLFGRDLAAGEAWRTRVRLVVDAFAGDAAKHLREYERFIGEAASLASSIEMNPYFVDNPVA
jgi:hypothetical protein